MQKLPKAERLRAQKQIVALMEKGSICFHFPFKVFFALVPADAGRPNSQMAVTVPKRNFKRAVKRNLLKRRTREAFRKNKAPLIEALQAQNKTITVFFHYIAPEILPYDHIETSLRKILAELAEAGTKPADPPVAAIG